MSALSLICLGLTAVLGMGCQPRWSPEDAVRPGFEALDGDANGRLDEVELQRGSPVELNFENIDQDGSQAIGLQELLAMVRSTDPHTFDGVVGAMEPLPADGELLYPDPHRVRVIRVLFEFMAHQVVHTRPGSPVPSDERIKEAARTASLDSPESRAVAAELALTYTSLGLQVPPSVAARATPLAPSTAP